MKHQIVELVLNRGIYVAFLFSYMREFRYVR